VKRLVATQSSWETGKWYRRKPVEKRLVEEARPDHNQVQHRYAAKRATWISQINREVDIQTYRAMIVVLIIGDRQA